MAINKISIKNFKSYKDLQQIELGNFNILIGANSSGKTNFIKIFEFFRDITNFGIDNAISMHGGIEYVKNLNIRESENLSMQICSDKKSTLVNRIDSSVIEINETDYKINLKLSEDSNFEILSEKINYKCEFISQTKQKRKITEKSLGEGKIIITRENGNIKIYFDPENIPIKIEKEDIIPPFLEKDALLTKTFLQLQTAFMPRLFSNIAFYDIDPKLSKKATQINGKADLEEDGSNLSIVLKNIIANKDKKRKFLNLVKDLLSFVTDIDVEKFADKSLLFKLKETYNEYQYIPASLISDGTINITAFIIALYFEEKQLTIIEKPERNIHPYLISKMISMMKDASQNKQIIVTTHNPEIIKHAGLENILLVSRDKEGFSTISRPCDKEEIKIFLENDLGIEELYVQNLLEI